MSKFKTKELLVCLIMFIVIAFTATTVVATEGATLEDLLDEMNQGTVNDESDDYNDDIGTGNREQLDEDILENEPENETENVEEDETTSEDELTHTGIEDFPVFIAIAVLAISMIYAYRKVREYNV